DAIRVAARVALRIDGPIRPRGGLGAGPERGRVILGGRRGNGRCTGAGILRLRSIRSRTGDVDVRRVGIAVVGAHWALAFSVWAPAVVRAALRRPSATRRRRCRAITDP